MSILVDRNTKVLVQGLTGKTGSFHTEQALAYHGTKMVGGIHPKKGGEKWDGSVPLPIFATVAEGKAATGTNAELGKKIINESGLNVTSADDLDDAAKKIVAAVKG